MIGSNLLITRTRASLVSVRWTTLVDGVAFTFGLHLIVVGTRRIVSQMDVQKCQRMRMDNVWWGGGNFITMNGRGKMMMFLLGNRSCIGKMPIKITCCSLKIKRKINAVVMRKIGVPQRVMREKEFLFLY